MKQPIKLFFVVLFFGLSVSSWAVTESSKGNGSAIGKTNEQGEGSAQDRSIEKKEGVDILFILDCSGSMKKTDPQDFRKPATELMVSLLGPKDRIGLISFGDTAKTLVPLTDNFPENRKIFSQAIQKISSQDLTTDLYEAIRKGFEEIKGSQRSDKILLVMSDGQMDLGSKEKDQSALKKLFDLIPELIKGNIKLYTVAFTDLSDQKLLADLAQRTGGFFGMAKADKDLHVIFSSIFEQLKIPDTVPLEGDSFFIDKEIQEATVLITKQLETTTKLIDPNRLEVLYGRAPANVDWYQTKAFDLITIKKPVSGRWKVQLSTKEGNKIFIITDLALKSSLNQNQIYQGQTLALEAWLERNGQRLVEKKFLESLFFVADIKEPTGTHTKIGLYPNETEGSIDRRGIFSNRYTFKNTGNYTIQLTVDGKTFKRELVHQIKVIIPQPVQGRSSSDPRPAEKTARGHPEGLWVKAFIKFGLVNLGLLIISGLVILGFKWMGRRPKKKGNGVTP